MKKRNDSQARSNLIFQQARLCHQSGEVSRAVTLYGQVLSEQPRHTDSLYHLGEIAFRAGNMAQSAALLTRLLQIDPQYAPAYDILWQEREIVSVANLTRADGEAFMSLAPRVPVRTHVVPYPLARANEALADLRNGRLQGAAVLMC